MSARSDEELALAYQQELGREPRNLPEDHPDRWQWEYRGRPEEREGLFECLAGPSERAVVEQDALPGLAELAASDGA